MATNNIFGSQSLQFGYSTITTNSRGQQSVAAPIGNVSGIPTTSIVNKTVTQMLPTENLTGYPVISTGKSPFSKLDSTAVLQNFGGNQLLQASGNLTGWPVLYTRYEHGNPVAQVVLPGFAPAGSFQYDQNGMPSYKNLPSNYGDYSSSDIVSSPVPPQAPSMQQQTSANSGASQQASLDAKRRRLLLSSSSGGMY